MPRSAIPEEVAEVTPEWMTEVLSPHAPGVVVIAVEVLDAHSGTTGRARLGLTMSGDRGPLPETVFCKLAPFDPRQRALLAQFGIGVLEARFYAELADDVGVRIPAVWHAETGPDGSFIIVLEDLDASGCTFRRGGRADPAERAAATLEGLAGLHARFWESPRFAGDLGWVPERAGFGSGGPRDPLAIAASAHFAQRALDAFGAEMPPAFSAVGTLYRDRTAEILDLFDEGPRTLIHGDPHEGNLFDDGPVAGFFDWAMFSRSPAVRDVAYHCASSLPVEVRRSTEATLLRRYREALASAGVTLDADMVERQYRLFSVFAWVSMASTAAMGSRWQPADVGMEAMRRATAAVDDLDAVSLVNELLG